MAAPRREDNDTAIRDLERRVDKLERAAVNPVRLRGVATFTWPGATNLSNFLIVTHSIGRIPQQVYTQGLAPIGNTSTRGLVIDVDDSNMTTTTFQARCWLVGIAPGAGSTLDFWWEAIG